MNVMFDEGISNVCSLETVVKQSDNLAELKVHPVI
jgi:hypothetical protein